FECSAMPGTGDRGGRRDGGAGRRGGDPDGGRGSGGGGPHEEADRAGAGRAGVRTRTRRSRGVLDRPGGARGRGRPGPRRVRPRRRHLDVNAVRTVNWRIYAYSSPTGSSLKGAGPVNPRGQEFVTGLSWFPARCRRTP